MCNNKRSLYDQNTGLAYFTPYNQNLKNSPVELRTFEYVLTDILDITLLIVVCFASHNICPELQKWLRLVIMIHRLALYYFAKSNGITEPSSSASYVIYSKKLTVEVGV